ncbi:MAG: dTMP kinase [archaeon]
MKKGVFISFEGMEGCGKTTQIHLLKDYLEKSGYDVVLTREPGGVSISEQIRSILLNPDNKEMHPMTELLLYISARSQFFKEIVKPNIDNGKVVIADRSLDSSTVYQGHARGLGVDVVDNLNKLVVAEYMPQLTLVLDVEDIESAVLAAKKSTGGDGDRLEQEKLDFHSKVRDGYRQITLENPGRLKLVKRSEIETVHHEIVSLVKQVL